MSFSETEIALVKSCRVLQDVPPEVVLAMIGNHPNRQCNLPPDSVFIKAGQNNPGLFIIAHGIVELFVTDAEGSDKVLDFAKIGDTLAEETLFSDRPLQYSARSLTQTAMLHLPDTIIEQWMASYPLFARQLMTLVAERIHYLQKDICTFLTKRATARLVCYLLCHFDKAPRTPDGSYTLHIDVPRNKIASRLGITDSQVSRSFRELQDTGLIVAQGRGYFIPDVPALSKYVCPGGCDL
jgi:CRP-like cAMP-binding protein